MEFRSALERPSRWRKTEAVINLLERLASEEGFYKAEMQLVVSQLKKDLFVELTYLPEFIQKWLETTHVETFLSSRIPYHVLSSELIACIQRSESENAKRMIEAKEKIDAFQRAMETGNSEREALEKQLKAFQDHPMADITAGLQKEIAVLSADLKQATEHIVRLKKKKVSLRLMLKRRDEFMQELVETKKTLTQQVDELTQAQVQRDIQIKRLKEQQKALESHCTDLIAQTKLAAQRITGLEAQLMMAQNECITLKERAAVAFDELTPRPDWLSAGIVQVAPEKRKSSLECFAEMLKILHERKSSSPLRRKTKKVLSPIPA